METKVKNPKTWTELKNTKGVCGLPLGCTASMNEMAAGTEKGTAIEKSALALIKICKLIEIGYGGNATKNGWCITVKDNSFCTYQTFYTFTPFKFHTKEQAEEFLLYPENIQLLKDYFMF